jgi:hypothetical protein
MSSRLKKAHQKKSSVIGQVIMPIAISEELFTKFKTTENSLLFSIEAYFTLLTT